MSQITISKKEYIRLKKQSLAYRKKAGRFFESIIISPVRDVIEDFRKTKLYSDKFISDLENGLKKSSYGK